MFIDASVMAVLGAVAVGYAIPGLARLLNVRASRGELPEEFREAFSLEEHERSRQYLRQASRLEWIRESAGLAVTVAFVLAGGLGWLDGLVRGLGFGPVVSGLFFLGALSLGQSAADLPFAAWATFGLEARFGFNATTWRLFAADRMKGLLLGAVLGGVLLAAVLWAFERLGGLAWLAAWGLSGVFTLVMLVLGPSLILPLFNRYAPLPEGPLRQAIEGYAAAQGFALEGIFVMDGSKRSSKANAFFSGLGKRKRISLYDTLLNSMTEEQVLAVLAHEMGHARLGHIRQGFLLTMLHLGLVFGAAQLFVGWEGLQRSFGLEPSVYAGLTLFGLAWQPLALLLGVLANAFSRRREFEADAYAAAGPAGPEALAQALIRLSRTNLANLSPHPLTVWLHHAHPTVVERVRRLRTGKA